MPFVCWVSVEARGTAREAVGKAGSARCDGALHPVKVLVVRGLRGVTQTFREAKRLSFRLVTQTFRHAVEGSVPHLDASRRTSRGRSYADLMPPVLSKLAGKRPLEQTTLRFGKTVAVMRPGSAATNKHHLRRRR